MVPKICGGCKPRRRAFCCVTEFGPLRERCNIGCEHRPARIRLSAPLSLAGVGDAGLRHRWDGDGAGVSGGDEEGDR